MLLANKPIHSLLELLTGLTIVSHMKMVVRNGAEDNTRDAMKWKEGEWDRRKGPTWWIRVKGALL